MKEKARETVNYLKNILPTIPEYTIVLGSGLKNIVNEVINQIIIPYKEIPNFPYITVIGHGGDLIYGELAGKIVLIMSGRFHYYEGHSMEAVTFPMRVFALMGIKKVVLSNAAGGVNLNFKVGDVMIIRDHINLMPEHPLRGKNIDDWGPRFLDMSNSYDNDFIESALKCSNENNIGAHCGVYLALQGPTFETPAEYGMIKIMGADAVGMSTVPEVIIARHMGLRVFAISVITDLGGAHLDNPVSHEEVLHAADVAMPKVISIVKSVIENN